MSWIKLALEAVDEKFPNAHPQREEFIGHIMQAEAVLRMSEETWLHRADLQGLDVVAKDWRQHLARGVEWVSWDDTPFDQEYACGHCGYSFGVLNRSCAALRGLVETDDLCNDCHEQKQKQP